MKARRWMAWCGDLQISPHPRLHWDVRGRSAEEMKRHYQSAMEDKRRWDSAHPDKLAEVREFLPEEPSIRHLIQEIVATPFPTSGLDVIRDVPDRQVSRD